MKLLRLLPFVLLALGLFFAWRLFVPTVARQHGKPEGEGQRAVPVTAVTVVTRDVPIWLSGLGTAEAYNKVTIRPQASGMLDQIHFTEGQVVEAGDVLARIDPRPYQSQVAQAKAKVAQSSARLLSARQNMERSARLVQSGADSRQNYEEMEANVAGLAAQEQADKAALDAAQLALDYTVLSAPIAGRTGLRMIDEGNLVTANQDQGLVVISQLQPIAVVFTLSQRSLPDVRKRLSENKEPVLAQAVTDSGSVFAEGTLQLIDNQIDGNSGTMKMKASFPNADLALWPGQFLTARLLVETREGAVVVPSQAISAGLDGPFVYVITPDSTVEVRNVRIGPKVDDITVVEDGLKGGEKIVLDGQSKLQPHARITIQEVKP